MFSYPMPPLFLCSCQFLGDFSAHQRVPTSPGPPTGIWLQAFCRLYHAFCRLYHRHFVGFIMYFLVFFTYRLVGFLMR
jgi:hypothetical protein